MTTKQWKITFYLIVLFGIWLFGFFLGRKTIDEKTVIKIEYVKGDTIKDTINCPVPYEVILPVDTLNIINQCIKDGIYQELFPTRVITEYVEVTKEDSSAILKDWATQRLYSETLFDNDTLGNCTINANVQYNRVKSIDYTFVPITKVVEKTVYTKKLFSPFIGVGAMINPWDEKINPFGELDGGFFIKEKYGVELRYQHSFKDKNDFVGGSLLYKF